MPRDNKKQGTNTDGHIPRPANSFLLFRSEWLKESIANSTQGDGVRQEQRNVSRRAGEAWRSLSEDAKGHYQKQAQLVKEEHSRKYPEYVYKPRAAKNKSSAVDDAAPHGPPTKRVVRGRTATPYQNPSVDAKGKRNAEATPFTPITAQTESVWDRSWFSGGSPMKDPFYSVALQPLASESPPVPPPVVQTHPHFFLPQVHGIGMAPNFPAMSTYRHDGGLRNLERHGHNALPPANNALGLLDFRPLSQATTQAEPLVSRDHPIYPSNSPGDSTPTAGTSMGEVPTPVLEAELPTESLMKSSGLIYDKSLESYYYSNDWEGNSEFNPVFDLFSMTEL